MSGWHTLYRYSLMKGRTKKWPPCMLNSSPAPPDDSNCCRRWGPTPPLLLPNMGRRLVDMGEVFVYGSCFQSSLLFRVLEFAGSTRTWRRRKSTSTTSDPSLFPTPTCAPGRRSFRGAMETTPSSTTLMWTLFQTDMKKKSRIIRNLSSRGGPALNLFFRIIIVADLRRQYWDTLCS